MTKSEHQDFKIEPMDINKIIPYEKNTKKHPDNQIDIIASSIDKFKFDQPIVVDENNVIIKGHGRLLGAKRLGLKSVPVIIRSDMSNAEKKASRIADNKSNESDWDFELLELELDELKELDFDMDWLEFDSNGNIGWNPDKTEEALNGDGINEKIGYTLSSFWKDMNSKGDSETYKYYINLPINKKNVINLKGNKTYSRTNTQEVERIIKTYMRGGDYFLENCCGWSTFGSSAKYFGYSGVGVDIWDIAISHSNKQLFKMPGAGKVEIKNMDGMNLDFEDSTFDFVYCNPPFMDQEKYSGLGNDIADGDFDSFALKFIKLMSENYRVLKPDCLCIITMNDYRKNGYLIPLQKYVIEWGERAGFKLWDFVIAEVLSKRIRLRKKDYELKRTVKCHEYVIVFKKPGKLAERIDA